MRIFQLTLTWRMTVLNVAFLVIVSSAVVLCGELTFELPDSERMCFNEQIDSGVAIVLEFQVVQGGNYDVDLELKDPNGKSIYRGIKKQYDNIKHNTTTKGVYEFCFSNEFSTVTHKVVYFDFQNGPEKPLQPGMEHQKALTQIETSTISIHEHLKTIADYQTHHRLREMSGRSFAEDLNQRVMVRSAIEFVVILLTAVTQVLILRSFFSEKKDRIST